MTSPYPPVEWAKCIPDFAVHPLPGGRLRAVLLRDTEVVVEADCWQDLEDRCTAVRIRRTALGVRR
ncbi:hypothetical protein SMC26_33030 [Actinomadura fulvescens]|uniref:Uncharacterized protein n=1 Tax=Actinomadura fulvescens TaxID=46160 RepID=A0ABN3QBJ5_9ACTN